MSTPSATVQNVNDAPSGSDSVFALISGATQPLAASDFGFSDVVDGDSLAAVTITTVPASGTLTLNGTAVSDGQTINIADIAAGRLHYTPAANASGINAANLTFQVIDDGGTAFGGIDKDPSVNTLQFDVTFVASTTSDEKPFAPPEPPPEPEATKPDSPVENDPGAADEADQARPATDTRSDERIEEVEEVENVLTAEVDSDTDETGETEAELAVLEPTAQVQALDVEHDLRLAEAQSANLTSQLYTARFPVLESNLFLKTFLFNSLHFELNQNNDPAGYSAQSLQIVSLDAVDSDDRERDSAEDTGTLLVIASGKSAGAALTAGFVAWVLRAGTLASAAISSLPVWRGFDPLPIFPDDDPDTPSSADDEWDLGNDVDGLFSDNLSKRDEID